MNPVFIITNQHQHLLGKQGQWLDADDVAHCFRTPHYDIALNQLIEANSREIDLRLNLMECPMDDKGLPLVADAVPARKRAVHFDDELDTPAAPVDEDADVLLIDTVTVDEI
jgi:hypothetical protein